MLPARLHEGFGGFDIDSASCNRISVTFVWETIGSTFCYVKDGCVWRLKLTYNGSRHLAYSFQKVSLDHKSVSAVVLSTY